MPFAIHESGMRIQTIEAFADAGKLMLEEWGRIEGVAFEYEKPVQDGLVRLNWDSASPGFLGGI